MSQFALAVSIPVLRRVFDWWLAQMKHALPPTIFFFVGFNLILWTKSLILQEHGIEFSGFLTATLAALLVGKAVLVTDNLPFMHRCIPRDEPKSGEQEEAHSCSATAQSGG